MLVGRDEKQSPTYLHNRMNVRDNSYYVCLVKSIRKASTDKTHLVIFKVSKLGKCQLQNIRPVYTVYGRSETGLWLNTLLIVRHDRHSGSAVHDGSLFLVSSQSRTRR